MINILLRTSKKIVLKLFIFIFLFQLNLPTSFGTTSTNKNFLDLQSRAAVVIDYDTRKSFI